MIHVRARSQVCQWMTIVALVLPAVSWAQETSSGPEQQDHFLIGVIADGSIGGESLSEFCTESDSHYFEAKTVVFVLGKKDCSTAYSAAKPFLEVAWRGKTYFIDADKVTFDEPYKTRMDNLDGAGWAAAREEGLTGSMLVRRNELEKALKALEGTKPQGLAVVSWAVVDESEYTNGTGVRIAVYNPTKKTIKYIWFTIVGINAVDDAVGGPRTVKAIGPLDADASGEYRFEYVWPTDIVESAKFRQIKVQYMDGSQKVITRPGDVVLDADAASVLSE